MALKWQPNAGKTDWEAETPSESAFDAVDRISDHKARHIDGSDDIQDATAAQKGVATAAQITKLDGIAVGADVTGSNAPQAHAASHTDGSDDVQDATASQKGLATAAQITKLDGIAIRFSADVLDSPNNSDWAVNALAPAVADSNNNGLTIRAFDDTTEEGVGFNAFIPAGTASLKLKFKSRAEVAPGAVRTVGLKLYSRQVPDNAAITAAPNWTVGDALADIDIPTNELFQYDEETITLATLGLTADRWTQFELTRVNPAGGTELVGDWDLLEIELEFII